ncbi:hypothetical protein JB92DRAFT_3107991 [Gautieria morchelliformis]|nr:hypothetical protein JB92DRAFT_3107991 [Gautieria morchelliformis]
MAPLGIETPDPRPPPQLANLMSWTSCARMAPHAGMNNVGSNPENDMDFDGDHLLVLPNLTANPRRSTCRRAFRFNSLAHQVPRLRYCLTSWSSPSPHPASPSLHSPPHRVPAPPPVSTAPALPADAHPPTPAPPRPSTSSRAHRNRTPHPPTRTDPQPQHPAHSESGAPPPTATGTFHAQVAAQLRRPNDSFWNSQ